MSNKGFNPLFLSALDILTGALGVFIILNFLNTRLAGVPPVPPPKVAEAKPDPKKPALKPTTEKPQPETTYRPWWRKQNETPEPAQKTKPEKTEPQEKPATTAQAEPKPEKPAPVEERIPTPPQDPVAVDLMKQTQGAVVLLLQQPDKAKAAVEFMLKQGSRTWKPTRASKYQDNVFQFQRGLNYFYQTEIQPGTYEVLVKVRRGERGAAAQTIGFFGKLVPPGQKSRTYNFGNFDLNGAQSDWTSAGYFQVSNSGLIFQSRLSKASEKPVVQEGKPDQAPASTTPNTPKTEPTAPAPKPKRSGKWG
jgi:hypothetical protein